MKVLDFSYDCKKTNISKMSVGTVVDILQTLEDELDYQEAVSLYYVETFDEIKEDAAACEACEYDYAMELIQGYSTDRARIVMFSLLELISQKDRDSYLKIIDTSIALCKRFLRESAIWKG